MTKPRKPVDLPREGGSALTTSVWDEDTKLVDPTPNEAILFDHVAPLVRGLQGVLEAGMPRARLAVRLGVTTQALRNLLGGRSWPNLSTMLQMQQVVEPRPAGSASIQPLPPRVASRVGPYVDPDPDAVERALFECACRPLFEKREIDRSRDDRCVYCVFWKAACRSYEAACTAHPGDGSILKSSENAWDELERYWDDRVEDGDPTARLRLRVARDIRRTADAYVHLWGSGAIDG